MNKPFIIGVAGGSGSGKTLFLNCFLKQFQSGEVSLISQDNYYKPKEQQPVDENGWINFDLPQCVDNEMLLEDLKVLINGETFRRKAYAFNVSQKPEQLLTIRPAPILIVEGLFVFHFQELCYSSPYRFMEILPGK